MIIFVIVMWYKHMLYEADWLLQDHDNDDDDIDDDDGDDDRFCKACFSDLDVPIVCKVKRQKGRRLQNSPCELTGISVVQFEMREYSFAVLTRKTVT